MKKIFFGALSFLIISASVQSQVKTVLSANIKTPNALCENCKKRIEDYVKYYDGVIEMNVNYRKGETKIKYYSDRINIEEIKAYIANCGYDADDVPAAEDAYKRLPKTCKKYEEGGGHPKPKVTAVPKQ